MLCYVFYGWSLDAFVFGRLPLLNVDSMSRSTVLSEELRSVYFATELLCLSQHSWELSNSSMSLSMDEIDELISVFVVSPTSFSPLL